jgi:antitoxin (DNA-binding transcriptional repressor) of toxin-antitoxin stability system
MKTVSARQANHDFSKLLSRVERGEKILITKWSKPVPLSAAAADSGTASRHQSCNRGDGTRATLGRDPGNFHAR